MSNRNDNENEQPSRWILVLVAHNDDAIEPRVLKERISADDDEQLCAFLRGGELVAVLGDDDELIAEAHRAAVERECLRIR